jgi:hypothetical protein
MNILLPKEDWRHQWRGMCKSTLSSESGLHFGHYLGVESDYISHFHALKASLIIKRGIILDRWARGLSVMLEKIFECALITKLRSILLMEANFNATNKIIYGRCMMDTIRKYKLMPEEIFSKKNHLADDGTLAKELFYNIIRQACLPAGITAIDADNCYNSIAHPIASLIFQALGLPKEADVSMCSMIQNMKFSLWTGFGDLTEVVGATGDNKTQGMCEGNGAAGASWTVTSIAMINAHKKKGHGVRLITPITKKKLHLAGLLFVGDMDLKHLNTTKTKTTIEALAALQGAVMNWGQLLIASRRALKLAKCFYHLISFQWMADGTWRYNPNHENPDFQIHVLLGNGELAPIEHLSIDSTTKNARINDMPFWM